MYLDREHRMLETRLIASGNADSVEIRAAAVLRRALALEAAAIIIAHNTFQAVRSRAWRTLPRLRG